MPGLARPPTFHHPGALPIATACSSWKPRRPFLEKGGNTLPEIRLSGILHEGGQDFDVVESNEAFAAQALAVARELDLDPAKTNPDGGAIALGHQVGATGTILTVKAVHYLHRTGGRYGLVTMCIGGGQGIALAVETL